MERRHALYKGFANNADKLKKFEKSVLLSMLNDHFRKLDQDIDSFNCGVFLRSPRLASAAFCQELAATSAEISESAVCKCVETSRGDMVFLTVQNALRAAEVELRVSPTPALTTNLVSWWLYGCMSRTASMSTSGFHRMRG